MNPIPSCGHPQCAGETFCGFTGQRIVSAPPPAPPPPAPVAPARRSLLWLWLTLGGFAVVGLLVAALWLANTLGLRVPFAGGSGGGSHASPRTPAEPAPIELPVGETEVARRPRSEAPAGPFSRQTNLRIPGMQASIPATAQYVPSEQMAGLGLEAIAGRLLNDDDQGIEPTAAMVREEYAEMVVRGIQALREASPKYAGRSIPTPEDFIGQEIEVAGRRAVIVGIVGPRPVTRGVLRSGFGPESSIVYLPSSAR